MGTHSVQAATPESAPAELKTAVTQIDKAANDKDIKGVLQFYSDSFKSGDGMDRATLEKTLTELWQRYPKLSYRTELKDWKAEGNTLVAETVTTISGTQMVQSKSLALNAIVRSRQYFQNNQIVQQEILTEQSQLTAGTKPPSVDLSLPESVKPGEEFNLDVVVKEPLGDRLLLGAAFDKPVNAAQILDRLPSNLDVLSAGGLFKVGKAPTTPQNLWISAVLIREDGINILTRRLRVTNDRASR
jgi:hypothetical protein